MLAEFAKELNLRQFSLLGKSYKWKHKSEQNKILAQMFEALVGVIFLEFDRDLGLTYDWLVESFIAEAVDRVLITAVKDDDSDLETDFQLIDWIEALNLPLLNQNSLSRKNNPLLECFE
ncbi:MAG: hypothetical protein F6K24_57905 [Okeania sp. SIO2D1]|nr:hypothetical protein [Okeania sp. SIO2D1]